MRKILIIVLLAALAVPLTASAGPADQRLFDKIADAVNRYSRFTIFDDVSAEVENGLVTLTGKVTMPHKKDDIARLVEKVDGVKEVKNAIDVLPVSIFDDELRFRIARAIYGNPSFWQYASMANPPIHIVVDRGHVTLSGVVASNVEKVLARSLAVGFGEFSVTNKLKTELEGSGLKAQGSGTQVP